MLILCVFALVSVMFLIWQVIDLKRTMLSDLKALHQLRDINKKLDNVLRRRREF